MTRPVLLSQKTPSHIQQSFWSDQDERTRPWSVRPRLSFRRACLSFSLQEILEIDSALKKKKLKLKVAERNHTKKSTWWVAKEAAIVTKEEKSEGGESEVWVYCNYLVIILIYTVILQPLYHFSYYYIILIKTLTCWPVLLYYFRPRPTRINANHSSQDLPFGKIFI